MGHIQKSVDCDLWAVVTCFLNFPVILIDINPHTKFQVATMLGTLKSTTYKTFNRSLTGSHTYGHME